MLLVLASLVANFVIALITLMEFLILARALLTFFPEIAEGKIGEFVFTVTEPVIIPARAILSKIEATKNLPFDLSYIVAILILSFVQFILSFFTL
jgi:YggT family protein